MTQSFDEWFIKQLGDRDETQPPFKIAKMWASGAYKAGAQSKQAEIDELRNMVKKLISNTIIGFDDDLENQARDLLKGTTNEQ